jgi:uncharacterized tellurite resistance protein B-like protein
MSFSFSRFFSAKPGAPDGLTQTQREAIADLLHFCVYADNHIALNETAAIERIVSTLNWDTSSSFASFESRSIAAARAAKENEFTREEFLKSIRLRLDQPAARTLALNLCKQIFVSDGAQSDKETVAFARIRQLLT